ncbi:MAG TPA: lipopolysaccharide heptosyltransferase II [Planctomycetota bacterium]|nr:lipopolysaccharide heptosyltransferase II [Planctomycetota bacterium]
MWPFQTARMEAREFARIVVRVPNPLGDQIMATAALDALRKRFPSAHIAGHGSATAKQLYAGMDCFDEFLVSGRRESVWTQAALLRRGRFDLSVLLAGSFRSALPPFLARIRHRAGYRWSGRSLLLTARWPRPKPGGKAQPYPTKQFYLDLVGKLGATGAGRSRLVVTGDEEARAALWMKREGLGEPLLSMCVGAAFGPSKMWPAESFAAVGDAMAERFGARVVLLCAPGEREVALRVKRAMKAPLPDTWTDPLDVGMLKAVIARSRALLTNDTGPRHIAACLNVPVVCLMGPTSPVYTEADTEGQVVLRREDVACSPCHLPVCPIDHRCMTWIKPKDALEAVERVWVRGESLQDS